MRKELSTPVFLLLALFAYICIWTSMDFYSLGTLGKLDTTFHEYFYLRKIHVKLPPIIELLIVLLTFLLYSKGVKERAPMSQAGAFFVGFSLLNFGFVVLNPNSPLGMLNLLSESLAIFTLTLLLWIYLRVDEEYWVTLTRNVFASMAVLAVLRAAWALGRFAIGKGTYAFHNFNATMSEGDVLYFMSFLQLMMLGLWIATKDKKYLLGTALLFLLIIFSFRRTWVALSLFGSIGIVMVNSFMNASFMKRLVIAGSVLVLFYLLIFQAPAIISLFGAYGERYSAILYAFRENPNTGRAGDSGHQFEATYSMAYALSHLRFFGVGIEGRFPTMIVLEAWSAQGVHNVYADMLIRHGIMFFLFFISMIVYTIGSFFQLLGRKQSVPESYFVLKLSVLVYLLLFYLVLFYNATWFKFDYSKFNFLVVPIFVFLIRFKPEHVPRLLGEKESETAGIAEAPGETET